MGNVASADNNLNKAIRASEKTAAENKRRRAASAEKRAASAERKRAAAARAAAGGRNANLEEALQISAAMAASLAEKSAASATRKRATSAERRAASATRRQAAKALEAARGAEAWTPADARRAEAWLASPQLAWLRGPPAAEEARTELEELGVRAVEARPNANAALARAAARFGVGSRNNAEDPELQQALQLSMAAAAAARGAAVAADDPKRRQRRKSGTKGSIAARQARELVGSCPAGVTGTANHTFIQRLLAYLPQELQNFSIEQHADVYPGYDFTPDRQDLECVGVILGFHLSTGSGHFVPYIKINGDWYNGDDEKGVLVRRTNGIPTMRTKYVNSEGIVDDGSTIFYPITFYCWRDTIEPRPQKDYTGTPVFGQSGLTCGPDASQTIFMLADGFYSLFHEKIYRILEPKFDPRLSVWHHEDITEEVLTREIAKLNSILNRILDIPEGLERVELNKFILMMCIRYFSIENTPEESLAVIVTTPNNTHG